VQATLAQGGLASAGVREVRVAAVDQDVARFHQRGELVDHGVGRRARLDHDHHAARPFQRGDELADRLGRHEGALVAVLGDQGDRPRVGAVVQGDGVAVPGQVAREVAAHHRESGDADLCHLESLRVCSVPP